MDSQQIADFMREHELIFHQNCFYLSGAMVQDKDSHHIDMEITLLIPLEVESETPGVKVVCGCQLVRFTNRGEPHMIEFPLTAEEFIALGKLSLQFHRDALEETIMEEAEGIRVARETPWTSPEDSLWTENPDYTEEEEVPQKDERKLRDRDNLDEVLRDLGDHPFGDG